MARLLRAVSDTEPSPAEVAVECVEGLVRASVQRRACLKREIAAEEARFTWLRRRLADQRGIAFIRAESAEREFLK